MPHACVIGTAAVDVKARMARPALETTDVPGRIQLMPGGVARNMAENLARLGLATTFIGAMGDDLQARMIMERGRAAGLAVRPVTRAGLPTASLVITLDAGGRQVAGVFSGQILDTLTAADLIPYRDAIQSAAALVVDSGVPESAILDLAATVGAGSLLCLAAGSAALAPRLRSALPRCDLITCNHLEADALIGAPVSTLQDAAAAARALAALGAKRAVVTLGPDGLACATAADCHIHPARPARVADATGAGDALAAAMIDALLRGEDTGAALSLGLSAAALTCEVEDSVAPDISPGLLRNRLGLA